ncbi:MAG: chromosome segregation protein SMC [bacterium]
MRFKRLELLGFKSFVDRTVVEFSENLTAVVGPNGCGKSNISDAIRWVLGEQGPKNLRAKKMEDVIFNGSADRKPLGMAEVSLTITDLKGTVTSPEFKDFSELVVTRRLYRSGESEYLINRNPCRLKDIVDLFLDTGISLDTFSIIEQGRIESLVNAKPMDRRVLIEEAAGIMKYKSRRNEALRKLELAQANLLRVGDVMREKETRLRSLRRQARKATFHKEYLQEINELEIRMSGLDFLRLETDLEPAEKEFAQVTERNEVHAASLSAREAEREKCRIDVIERSEALAEVRRRAVEVEGYLQRLENRLEMLTSRLEELGGEDERRREELTSLREESERMGEERERLTAMEISLSGEAAEARRQFEESAGKVSALRARLAEWEASESEVKEVRSRESEALSSARQRLASGGSRREANHESIERLESELSGATRSENEIRGEADSLAARLAEVSAAVTSSKKEAERAIDESGRLEALLREGDESVATMRESLVESRSSLQAIENLAGSGSEDRIGPEDFKSLGVEFRGQLAELLEVEPRHEKAIEAALGLSLKSVVVPDQGSAASAIKTLISSSTEGRGLVLPLSARRAAVPPIPHFEGAEGRAPDLVRVPGELRPLIESLLAGVGIARDLDAALAAWRNGPEGITWVTLAGEVVYPSGGVEGGRSGARSGILERKRRCEELRLESAGLGDRVEELALEQAGRREALEGVKEAVNRTAGKVRELELARVELDSAHRAAREKLSAAEDRLRGLSGQRTELMGEKDRLERESRETESEAARAGGALREADARGEETERELKRLGEEASRGEEAAADRRVALTEAQGKAAGVHTELQRVAEAIGQNESRMARRTEEEEDSAQKRESLKLNLEQSSEEIARMKEERVAVEIDQGERSRNVEEVRARDEELAEVLRDMREEASRIQASLSDAAERRTTLRVQRETMIESARENFDIDLIETAQEVRDQLPEYQEHANRLDMLRQRLQRMGEVNPLAAQEFDEINQEYSFLTEQQGDLDKSIDDLHATIDKLNQTTRKRFLEAFEKVSEQFAGIFGRLFQGGEARMYLLDPNDPLETGVDIEVRPPGKRPGNIMLLSSGEKALTALALLFAVFSVRPSPFCLLDEVDATLDDANVGRFRDSIKELEDRSQFVLITHNKRTMSYASQLYGITQREKGVSIIVSVKMNRRNEVEEGADVVAAMEAEEA